MSSQKPSSTVGNGNKRKRRHHPPTKPIDKSMRLEDSDSALEHENESTLLGDPVTGIEETNTNEDNLNPLAPLASSSESIHKENDIISMEINEIGDSSSKNENPEKIEDKTENGDKHNKNESLNNGEKSDMAKIESFETGIESGKTESFKNEKTFIGSFDYREKFDEMENEYPENGEKFDEMENEYPENGEKFDEMENEYPESEEKADKPEDESIESGEKSNTFVGYKYAEFYMNNGYALLNTGKEQYYAKDSENNEIYFTDPTGDEIYAYTTIKVGDKEQRVEYPAVLNDNTPTYVYEHGNPRYPENLDTGNIIFPKDPITKEEMYLQNSSGEIKYPRNKYGTEFYRKDADNNEIPISDYAYAKDASGREIYPKYNNGDEYYLKVEGANSEIGAYMHINGERVPYYARKQNGDEFYPRYWSPTDLNIPINEH